MCGAQVRKLEQLNSSAFELSRAFKFFDKDHSQTIDVHEFNDVLKSFALELNSAQLNAVMERFQAKVCDEFWVVKLAANRPESQDQGDGHGLVISYPDFVRAVVRVTDQHPFAADKSKMIEDGWRRDSAKVRASYGVGSLSGIDQYGR